MEDCMINPPEAWDYGYPEQDECPGCGAQAPARCRCNESPWREDNAICQLAEEIGMEMSRFASVEITDLAAIQAAGLMCAKPDYARIRKLMASGAEVPGAKLGSIEYKLRKVAA